MRHTHTFYFPLAFFRYPRVATSSASIATRKTLARGTEQKNRQARATKLFQLELGVRSQTPKLEAGELFRLVNHSTRFAASA